MVTPLSYEGLSREVYCECCAPRYATYTASSGHKWTRKEIESEILSLSGKLSHVRWFSRGPLLRSLKHWSEKLERLNRAEEEFGKEDY